MPDNETVLKIAELWFNQDYSPLEISQELDVTLARVSAIVEHLDDLKQIIAKGMLERVKIALDL